MASDLDHLDDVMGAIRAVSVRFRAGLRQGEHFGLEGLADVQEQVRLFEEDLKQALQKAVSPVWSELGERAQTRCRRAGVFG